MEYYLTKDRLKELEEELKMLKVEGRREVSENLKAAKELGDLSENAEYLEAREQQQKLEKRINELEQMVRNVVVIGKKSKKKMDEVSVGSTVEVSKGGVKSEFFIVGSNEARPEGGFISNESPLGQALMGAKVGDEVSLTTPGGRVKYKILKIS